MADFRIKGEWNVVLIWVCVCVGGRVGGFEEPWSPHSFGGDNKIERNAMSF